MWHFFNGAALKKRLVDRRVKKKSRDTLFFHFQSPELVYDVIVVLYFCISPLHCLFHIFFSYFQGSVAFSEETGDRIAWTKIEQLQNKKYEVVAFYDQKSDNLTWLPPQESGNCTVVNFDA